MFKIKKCHDIVTKIQSVLDLVLLWHKRLLTRCSCMALHRLLFQSFTALEQLQFATVVMAQIGYKAIFAAVSDGTNRVAGKSALFFKIVSTKYTNAGTSRGGCSCSPRVSLSLLLVKRGDPISITFVAVSVASLATSSADILAGARGQSQLFRQDWKVGANLLVRVGALLVRHGRRRYLGRTCRSAWSAHVCPLVRRQLSFRSQPPSSCCVRRCHPQRLRTNPQNCQTSLCL